MTNKRPDFAVLAPASAALYGLILNAVRPTKDKTQGLRDPCPMTPTCTSGLSPAFVLCQVCRILNSRSPGAIASSGLQPEDGGTRTYPASQQDSHLAIPLTSSASRHFLKLLGGFSLTNTAQPWYTKGVLSDANKDCLVRPYLGRLGTQRRR